MIAWGADSGVRELTLNLGFLIATAGAITFRVAKTMFTVS